MYKLILNEANLINFINFLPELQEDEVYFVALFARSKYTNIPIRNKIVKSFYCRKEFLLNKIKELEVKEGLYMSRGESIPYEALALYISPNPRSLTKAKINFLTNTLNKVFKNEEFDLVSSALSEIQNSNGTNYYTDFDFDKVLFEDTKDIILKYVNKEAIVVLHTRGGFHLLINMNLLEDKYKNTFYQNIRKIEGVDIPKSKLVPIVGCSQGLFEPYLEFL